MSPTTLVLVVGVIMAALLLGDLAGAGAALPLVVLPVLLLGSDRLRSRIPGLVRGGGA